MNWLIKLLQKLFGSTTNTNNNDNSNGGDQGGTPAMNKKAVCIGINDYPGTQNDLAGCVNDCNTWAGILSGQGFGVTKLINSQADSKSVKAALSKLVSEAKTGDIIVFTYSGHGSFVVDMTSPKPDHKNETIYAYDGNVFDYEIRSILDGLADGVSMTVVLDSCHSGTATRLAMPGAPKPRFMPPRDPAMAALGSLPTAKRVFITESQMKEVLFAGCKSTEYSYDARIGGTPMGAFSYYATRSLKDALANSKSLSCQGLFDAVRKQLPSSDYPQTPQLEGSDANKARQILT